MISRLSAEFTDPSMERAYREASFADARLLNRATALIASLIYLSFGAFDYITLGATPLFYTLFALRLGLLATAVVAIGLTRNPKRFRQADLALLVVQLYIVALFLVVAAARSPAGFLYPPSVSSYGIVMIVLGNYVFIATRFSFCASVSILATVSYLGVSLAFRPFTLSDLAMEGAMLVGCNLLGMSMLHRIRTLQRRQFGLLTEERLAGERLQAQSRELRTIARDLARARDEATIANRAKSEFLAHMSHELRSPLNAIIGFTEVMTTRMFGAVEPPRYREYVEDIHASGVHLLAVINDLLDLSKAESGRMELNETPVEIEDAATSAMRLVRERAYEASVKLLLAVPETLPDLLADERMIKQIILNLLTNSVKFTQPGGSIEVSARICDDGRMALTVKDTGVGIAAADIPKVLEAYGQADIARARSTEGTGLGLPLVKSMAELHGGDIALDSTPGEGTAVTLYFPAERVVARAMEDAAEDRIAG
jgi:two-component system cell cycle sensor histidine kinase PleC